MISPRRKQQSIRPTGIFLKYRVVNARNVGLGLQLDSCDGKPFAKLFQLLFDLLVLFWWFSILTGCLSYWAV
jgi:hypothetical protein